MFPCQLIFYCVICRILQLSGQSAIRRLLYKWSFIPNHCNNTDLSTSPAHRSGPTLHFNTRTCDQSYFFRRLPTLTIEYRHINTQWYVLHIHWIPADVEDPVGTDFFWHSQNRSLPRARNLVSVLGAETQLFRPPTKTLWGSPQVDTCRGRRFAPEWRSFWSGKSI